MSDDSHRCIIVYGSQSGTTKRMAHTLASSLNQLHTPPTTPPTPTPTSITHHENNDDISFAVRSMNQIDPEDIGVYHIIIALVSTYSGGKPPTQAKFFCEWINDAVNDARVDNNYLAGSRFAVIGFGNSAYEEDYNLVAKKLHTSFHRLGAQPIQELTLFDKRNDGEIDMETWAHKFMETIHRQPTLSNAIQHDDVNDADDSDDDNGGIIDLEEIGNVMLKHTQKTKTTNMLTSTMKKNLIKQGYKVIGTHSGVKICRWTKAQLRGRGGCYKHTMYGIVSYRCMEMTPSLACANKCVFCWRHHTNPVGKSWTWNMDEPELIIEGAIENHIKMINQMRGVPGVIAERFAEAFHVRHCALSLVGEPIMYPKINGLLALLHARHISTFLVTNAQFPDCLRNLDKVTQLYVSIDAATEDTLQAVDRPLHADFWQRFMDSIDAIRESKQRTVFRLTLLKGHNMTDDEMTHYAELVHRGQPDFIEVKGVTFCGTSEASTLTMKNIPFHHEVRVFCEKLCELISELRCEYNTSFVRVSSYGLACEHAHSCCVLIANQRFHIDNVWYTHIDYDKFHELLANDNDFDALDYAIATPAWAAFGAEEAGFDPADTRWYRNKTMKARAATAAAEAAEAATSTASQ